MIDTGCMILAAGANERLKGLVPSFMKPLILVNGRPLVIHALEHAERTWMVPRKDVVIVAAPQNVSGITQVVGNDLNFIVQPHPIGVVDAIKRALPFMKREWTLILMADNTFEGEVTIGNELLPSSIAEFDGLIGVRTDIQSTRFTRIQNGAILPRESNELGAVVWIGPLALRTAPLCYAVGSNETIESLIMAVTAGGQRLCQIPMRCNDLGVPEEL